MNHQDTKAPSPETLALRWNDAAPYCAVGTTLFLRGEPVAEYKLQSLCQRAATALNALIAYETAKASRATAPDPPAEEGQR